jgi:hypothetical protein
LADADRANSPARGERLDFGSADMACNWSFNICRAFEVESNLKFNDLSCMGLARRSLLVSSSNRP